MAFLLTHPVWDVTKIIRKDLGKDKISTHTSRVGCDNLLTTIASGMTHFYSHIPCGM